MLSITQCVAISTFVNKIVNKILTKIQNISVLYLDVLKKEEKRNITINM